MRIQFFSKGPIEQISGGYLYNRYIVEYLQHQKFDVAYYSDPTALRTAIPADITIIDGLVLPDCLQFLDAVSGDLVLLLHMPVPVDSTFPPRTRFVTTSENMRDELRSSGMMGDTEIAVIAPGVAADWSQRHEYRTTAQRLLCLANYVPGKGHELLLDVLQRLTDLNWQLQMHGNRGLDTSYCEVIDRQIEARGLQDRVQASDAVPHSDVARLMQASDLLLQFSEHESYSMVTAEAIACGLPVLSSKTGNWQEFSRSGLVLHFDDLEPANVAGALTQLITNASSYAALRPAATTTQRSWIDVGEEFTRWLTLKP
ncbi:MAG: glycosyltransferase family 4 protein [Woeseiaceae bacterium]